MEKIFAEISDNKNKLKKDFTDCSDFLLRECIVGGRKCIVCVLDGMINSLQLSQMIMRPILSYKFDNDAPYSVYETIKQRVVSSLEMNEAENFEDAYFFLFSGFAVVFVDGMQKCLVMGIQGFEKKKNR